MICWVDTCMNKAEKRCSGCKTATYCSDACQKKHWSSHKKECKMQRMVYDMQQQEKQNELNNEPPKPRKTHCTGCGIKFDDDDYYVDAECPDCGYMACESCSSGYSRGSCYCQQSNFGFRYCTQEPRHYHCGKRGQYTGDYHPSKEDGYELNKEDHPEAFTDEPQACSSCKTITYLLKREYI